MRRIATEKVFGPVSVRNCAIWLKDGQAEKKINLVAGEMHYWRNPAGSPQKAPRLYRRGIYGGTLCVRNWYI